MFGILAALSLLFVPGYALGAVIGGDASQIGYWVGLILATFGSTVVAIFFQAALVIGANERAEGRNPTRGSVLAEAWKRRGRLISWAVLATTVGIVLRLIQERLGAAGAIVSVLGGLAWSIATFLVIPVLVAEDIGPISALKRSTSVLKETWGTSLRTTVRFGLIALLLWIPAIALLVLGIVVLVNNNGGVSDAAGVTLLAIGFVSLVVLGTVFSAVMAYVRSLIYRYAMGLPTPGIDTKLFEGAFQPKKAML